MKSMTDNGQKIIDLDRKRMNAMAQKDITTLNALLSDDLVYTHSTARLDTKKSLIEAMESGRTVYTDVYVNNGGQWQMVAWQSTRLPE
jgi:Domain of unknown function (DUF4440)